MGWCVFGLPFLPSFDDCENIQHIKVETNDRHFADDTFKRIFLNENARMFIRILLRFEPKGPNNYIPCIGSDNGLSSTRRQAIIWNNDG